MSWYELSLGLEEGVTIGRGAMVSNEIATLDFIPATTLRGAFYGEMRLSAEAKASESAEKWLGGAA